MVVEKMLAAEGKSRLGMGREAFTEQVWKWREQYGGFIQQQLRRLGASCDWSREGFTLDAQLSGRLALGCLLLSMDGMSSCKLVAPGSLRYRSWVGLVSSSRDCNARDLMQLEP